MSDVEKLIRLGAVLAESEDCDLSEIGDDISNLAHFWKKEVDQLRQKLEAAEAEVLRLDDECHVFSDECDKYKAACAQLSKDNVELRETIREAREQKPIYQHRLKGTGVWFPLVPCELEEFKSNDNF